MTLGRNSWDIGVDVTSFSVEIWKDVPGSSGKYKVSNRGRTMSFLGRYPHKDGKPRYHKNKRYPVVCFTLKGIRNYKLVHRIVWETFNGKIPRGFEINHRDGDKNNNCLFNLELVTPSQNIRHSYDMGLQKQIPGIEHHNSIFKDKDIKKIRKLIKEGTHKKEIAKIFNCHHSTIYRLRAGGYL